MAFAVAIQSPSILNAACHLWFASNDSRHLWESFVELSAEKLLGFSLPFPELCAYAPHKHFYKICSKELIDSYFSS